MPLHAPRLDDRCRWRTRPACGGGHSPSEGRALSRTPYGWGVERTEEIIECAIAGSSRRTARPPSSVLPHQGGGSAVVQSARALKSKRL